MSKRYLSTPKRKPPEMAQGSSKCASERGGNAEGSSRHGAMAAAQRLPGSWDDNELYPKLIAELVVGH